MRLSHDLSVVMAGLVPAIHVLLTAPKTWMPATSAGMTEERLAPITPVSGAARDRPAEARRLDPGRRVGRIHPLVHQGANSGYRAHDREEGMGAVHRLDRDPDARHHERPARRQARAAPQGTPPVISPIQLDHS